MTSALAMVVLAAVCWLLRVLLIVLVPAERLPARVRDGLGHLPPAVLAAMVAVETHAATRGGSPGTAALVLGAVLVIALAVRLTGSLALAVSLGLGAALLIDLVLVG